MLRTVLYSGKVGVAVLMKGSQIAIANFLAGILAIAAVGALLGPRLFHASAPTPSARHTATSLPSGVCALSVDSLPVADATRMEAKLITLESALSKDPYFPWRQDPRSTGARTSYPDSLPKFYWVVAAEGKFHLNAPVPPGGALPDFSDLVFHAAADSCQIDQVTSNGGWPTWFDQLPAVMDLKVK